METTAKEKLDKIPVLASQIVKVGKEKTKEYKILEVSNESLRLAMKAVDEDPVYGVDDALLKSVLQKKEGTLSFGDNIDKDIVAMKIGLIDVTNSTHLSQHKSKFAIGNLAGHIAKREDFDDAISRGDEKLVKWLAVEVLHDIGIGDDEDGVRLYSFASKYCCYHNSIVYGRDDFSKFDGIVSYCLPLYLNYLKISPRDYMETKSNSWSHFGLVALVKSGRYDVFNKLIGVVLDGFGIKEDCGFSRRIAFDFLMWYPNR
ncbi:MAG: hypothetical protein E7354_05505 [Clostridiales bacterium]|nr:hypothetical protein [Clostridiales bacterium]